MDKKFLVGSKQLGLSNDNSDMDYVILKNDLEVNHKVEHDKETNIDLFIYKTQFLKDLMNFNVPYINSKNIILYKILYQYDIGIINQDFPIEYHVLDHIEQWKEFLLYVLESKVLVFCVYIKQNNKLYCAKDTYHIAYLTYILKNNSTTLTAEQKQKIQTIHDKQMPLEFLDELKAEIMAL